MINLTTAMNIRAVNAPRLFFTSDTSKRLIEISPNTTFASAQTQSRLMYQTVASSGIPIKVGMTNLNVTCRIPYAMKRLGRKIPNTLLIIEGGIQRGREMTMCQ